MLEETRNVHEVTNLVEKKVWLQKLLRMLVLR